MTNKITFLHTLSVASAVSDPIYAAIEQHRKLVAESDRLYDELQKAENAAEKKQRQRRSVTCHRGVQRIADA
jgi:cell division protein FtsL